MLNLSIRHLLTIEAVSKSSNLKAAAGFLNITPSALTHRIKEAEQIIGAKLFNKQQGSLQMTQAGSIVLNAASICISELEEAESLLAKSQCGLTKTIKFGASSLSGLHWLPDLLLYLEQHCPDVELEIGLDVANDPIEALRQKKIDIALMPLRVQSKLLRNTFLFKDEMIAVLSTSHKKASLSFLNASDFIDETYIGVRPGRERGREYERFFEPASLTPGRIMPGRSVETIIALVRAGLGISIMSRWNAQHYLSIYELCAVPLTSKGLNIDWHAIIRSEEDEVSPTARVVDQMVGFWQQTKI